VPGETRVHVACQRDRLLGHQGKGGGLVWCCFCALRSRAILRSNCSRAIWRPINRARDRIAASARAGSFRPVSGPVEGDITSMLILPRLSAIVSNNPLPGRGRGYGSVQCRSREGLVALRAVNRIPWRRKGMGHSETGRGSVEANRLHSSLVEFESRMVRQRSSLHLQGAARWR